MQFAERCKIKKQLNNRLKSDGYWDQYNKLRETLKRGGVDESLAWRVAAYPFPPKDGSQPEIVADPMYAEIASGWADGKYAAPEPEATNGAADTAEQNPFSPDKWRRAWQELAAQVGPRSSGELEDIRWVVANYLVDVTQIEPDGVPSTAALSILSWVQASPSNFGDFLRTNFSKIIPDRKALEYQNRMEDDGRELKLLEEFERSLELEEASKSLAGA